MQKHYYVYAYIVHLNTFIKVCTLIGEESMVKVEGFTLVVEAKMKKKTSS